MQALQSTDYPSYYTPYISKLPDENILDFLQQQESALMNYLRALPMEKWDYAYAPGKWTIKQLVGHISDAETIFGYRALCLARGEKQSLPSFEENEYAVQGRFENNSPAQLMEVWQNSRKLNLAMFHSFDIQSWDNVGTANGLQLKTRALPYIIAGHAQHHFNILKERY